MYFCHIFCRLCETTLVPSSFVSFFSRHAWKQPKLNLITHSSHQTSCEVLPKCWALQKAGRQREVLAVPRASRTTCVCTLQFCCAKSPADFHTVQTLSPGKQCCSFSHPFLLYTVCPHEPREHKCQPGITFPAHSLCPKPGSLLNPCYTRWAWLGIPTLLEGGKR